MGYFYSWAGKYMMFLVWAGKLCLFMPLMAGKIMQIVEKGLEF